MKKRYIFITIIIVLIIFIIFSITKIKPKRVNVDTGEEPKIEELEKNMIRVSGSLWGVGIGKNGKEGAYSKQLDIKEYNIELNKEIDFYDGGLGLKFKIIEILNDGIKIKTDKKFSSKNVDDSVNLNSNTNEFFIKNNSQIKIATPTMDAGATYIIEIAR